jgi:hypothetical protein
VYACSRRAKVTEAWQRQPEGWPPYYPPRLVDDLAGTTAQRVTRRGPSIERGYFLHRIDLEKVRVLDARAARCENDARSARA